MSTVEGVTVLREEYLIKRGSLAFELAEMVLSGEFAEHGITSYIIEQHPEFTFVERMDLENFANSIAIFVIEHQYVRS